MKLFEISDKYKISMPKLRRLLKDGLLRVDGSDHPMTDDIRHSLSRNHPLTGLQLYALLTEPEIFQELDRYADRGRKQLEAIGTPTAAPNSITADIQEMSRGDMVAVGTLVDWLKTILPAKPVSHQWIAVRLLLGIPEALHKYEAARIPRVMLNARKHPAFAGWFTVDTAKANAKTFYCQPANNALDL